MPDQISGEHIGKFIGNCESVTFEPSNMDGTGTLAFFFVFANGSRMTFMSDMVEISNEKGAMLTIQSSDRVKLLKQVLEDSTLT